MPRRYEAIRDKFKREGMGTKEAKTRAAKIYNATRKKGQAPVTRGSDSKKKREKRLEGKQI